MVFWSTKTVNPCTFLTVGVSLQAIWLELQSTVHAVDSMTTKTPSEQAKQA